MRVICDIEANGLVDPDRVWCVVAYDIDKNQWHIFHEQQDNFYARVRRFAKAVTLWIGHNFLTYDSQILNNVVGTKIKPSQILDTLILSRLFSPVREGGHSLEAWGRKLGVFKQAHEEWDRFSKAMLTRCVLDVKINRGTYTYLCNEGKDFSERSIRIEHSLVRVLDTCRKYGWKLDVPRAEKLYQKVSAEVNDLLSDLQEAFPAKAKHVSDVVPTRTKAGKWALPKIRHLGLDAAELVGGPYTRIEWVEFNPNSPPQVVERLNKYGWEPVIFTKAGNPKVCEENLQTLPDDAPDEAQLIKKYLILNSRTKTVSNWFENLGEDERIHGNIIHIGAITNRCAHSNPNTANIPAIITRTGKVALYGEEMRKCWTVENPGERLLVGVDAKGIQLRVLAHLAKDEAFRDAVLGDMHTFHADLVGNPWGEHSRNIMKTFIYAWLLGAGHGKIGEIIGGTRKEGGEFDKLFLDRSPHLARVKQQMAVYAKKGWYPASDGRMIPIKSERFALSVALQGEETIVMRQALIYQYNSMLREKLDGHLVGFIHDEGQFDCLATHAERVGQLMCENIARSGKSLNLWVPMEGEAKEGKTWADTH